MSTATATISDWIQSGRKTAKLSVDQLAKKLDADADDVRKWESGESTPTVQHLNKLRELFGAPGEQKDEKEDRRDIDFESKLFKAADKLRNNMDAAEYKHVVLGLIFLKYISDAFKELYETLEAEEYADPEMYLFCDPLWRRKRFYEDDCANLVEIEIQHEK